MPPKFLLDEQISPEVAKRLRAAGVDAVSAEEVELAGQQDLIVFHAAVDDGRIMVTYDIGDYARLHVAFLKRELRIPGLIFVTEATIPKWDFQGLARALTKLAESTKKGETDPAGSLFLKR